MKAKRKTFLDLHSAAWYVLGAFLLCTTPALMYGQVSAGKPACVGSPEGCSGQNIKDSTTQLLTDMGTLTTNMGNMVQNGCQQVSNPNSQKACSMLENKVNKMKGDQQRAEGANKRSTAADYQKMNRRHSKNSMDGCDDTVQVCSTVPGGASGVAAGNSNEYDDQTGADTVANLSEADQDVQQINSILENGVAPTPPPGFPDLANADYFFPESMWPSPALALSVFEADLAAEKVADLARPACDETLVALGEGGNGAIACLVFETAYMILDATKENFEYILKERSYDEITGTYERVGNVYEGLKISAGQINAIQQEVKAMGKELVIIQQLLETPQGKRSGWPLVSPTSTAQGKSSSSPPASPHTP